MVIHVKNLAGEAATASEGALLYAALTEGLQSAQIVVVSFDGVPTVTASFTNASFLRLAQERGLSLLKDRVKILGASTQVREVLRDRVARSKSLQAAAA